MKLYKDKDSYNNSLLLNKQKWKKIQKQTRITSALLAFDIVLVGGLFINGVKFVFDKSNPFDGQSITSSDFCTNYKAIRARSFIEDESFKDVIQSIKNSNMDEKKAYLLYYALLSNEYLTAEEKEKLTGYIQYFIDNKYLDYEYVYNKLSLLVINPNDETIHEDGAAGIYNPYNNSIMFANDSDRDYAMSHETFHSEDKFLNLNLNKNSYWFIEGLTDLLSYEYNNSTIAYDAEVTFCRILCEFVGSDVLFETRATGDMNILIQALENKGVNKTDILELFKLFNDYNFLEKDERTINGYVKITNEKLKIQIVTKLIEIYNIVYKTPDIIKPIYWEYIHDIESDGIPTLFDSEKQKRFYYFNSQLKGPFEIMGKNYFGDDYIEIYHQDKKEIITWRLVPRDGENIKMSEVSISKISQSDFKKYHDNLLKSLNEYIEINNKTK